MNDAQLEKLLFVNGELNALCRKLDRDVVRVKARQSGAETQVTIVFVDAFTKFFDASRMDVLQITLQALARV